MKLLHALFVGGKLRPQIGNILFRVARRMDGAAKHIHHLGLAIGAAVDQLEIVDQHAFLVDMRGIRRRGPRRLAADIGMVPPAGDKEQDLALVEDRRNHGDIGKVRAAVIGVVQHIGIARADLALIVADHRTDGFPHRAQMHRHVRRVGDQRSGGIEDRAGKVQTFLHIHRQRRVLKGVAHLLGDRHEQVVEHLEHHRVTARADGHALLTRDDAAQDQIADFGHLGLPAGLDDGGRRRLGDQGRPVDRAACGDGFPAVDRCCHRRAAHIGVNGGERREGIACRHMRSRLDIEGQADGLDRDGGRDHPLAGHDKAEARAIGCLIGLDHLVHRAIGHLERGVRPVIAKMDKTPGLHPVIADPLRLYLGLGNGSQPVELGHKTRHQTIRQRRLDGALAQRAHIGKPHAIGRQHPGEWMYQHRVHAQHIGNQAGMLPAGAAKALQRIVGHIIAALHRDLLDGIGHVLDSNAQEAVGKLFRRAGNAGR